MAPPPPHTHLAQQLRVQLHKCVHVHHSIQGPVLYACGAQHVLLLGQHAPQHEAGCVGQPRLLAGGKVVMQQAQQLPTQPMGGGTCAAPAGTDLDQSLCARHSRLNVGSCSSTCPGTECRMIAGSRQGAQA
jgi:hypothetical protein